MTAQSAQLAFGRNALNAALLCLLLASCSESGLNSGAATAPLETQDASVFQKTDNALWDGRPSLGGVWIAHPDVTTPERVDIRNNTSGRTIQAALFRRERDFPGPAFQLSADAAIALKVTAGTPVPVTVTALRREPVAPVVEAAPTPTPAPVEDPALVAAASAAIDEAEGVVDPLASEIVVEPVQAGSAGSMLFGAKPQNTGLNAPVETADEPVVATVAPTGDVTPMDAPAPKGGSAGSGLGSKPTMVDDAGEPIPLEGSSLEPITATEILAAPLPEAAPATPEAALESAVVVEPEPTTEPAPGTSDLERPYVQVASGSTKANVEALAAKLTAAGMPAVVRETTEAGAPLFYVVVGPFATQADLDANLARIRELGYPEAFIAKG